MEFSECNFHLGISLVVENGLSVANTFFGSPEKNTRKKNLMEHPMRRNDDGSNKRN